MPVPADDTVCRFIDPIHWSVREGSPRETAFKPRDDEDLSVWHEGILRIEGATLDDLRIGSFEGNGKALHMAGRYLQAAKEASEGAKEEFKVNIRVEWRTEEEFVEEQWREWAYAHVQVEAIRGPRKFTGRFRKLLAAKSKNTIPPDIYLTEVP